MLRTRVITALVIAPIVLALIFFAPDWLFALAMLAMALIGAWEWSALAGRPSTKARVWLAVFFGVLVAAGVSLECSLPQVPWLSIYCAAALAWWVFSFVWLAFWRAQFPGYIKVICGVLTLLPSLAAVVAIRDASPWYLTMLLLLTVGADIGAYFAGRAFGKHKLAPQVSPGKTWEGVVGGMALAAVVALIEDHWLTALPAGIYVAVALLLVALSIVGDLSESLFKRQAGLKDSGGIFPGHGGMLDRVDSLTAAAPLYWLAMHYLQVLG
ncbi:MAG TPA: phosphatidate cytidylyltransferase [Gammaproteobacteria bacterium]